MDKDLFYTTHTDETDERPFESPVKYTGSPLYIGKKLLSPSEYNIRRYMEYKDKHKRRPGEVYYNDSDSDSTSPNVKRQKPSPDYYKKVEATVEQMRARQVKVFGDWFSDSYLSRIDLRQPDLDLDTSTKSSSSPVAPLRLAPACTTTQEFITYLSDELFDHDAKYAQFINFFAQKWLDDLFQDDSTASYTELFTAVLYFLEPAMQRADHARVYEIFTKVLPEALCDTNKLLYDHWLSLSHANVKLVERFMYGLLYFEQNSFQMEKLDDLVGESSNISSMEDFIDYCDFIEHEKLNDYYIYKALKYLIVPTWRELTYEEDVNYSEMLSHLEKFLNSVVFLPDVQSPYYSGLMPQIFFQLNYYIQELIEHASEVFNVPEIPEDKRGFYARQYVRLWECMRVVLLDPRSASTEEKLKLLAPFKRPVTWTALFDIEKKAPEALFIPFHGVVRLAMDLLTSPNAKDRELYATIFSDIKLVEEMQAVRTIYNNTFDEYHGLAIKFARPRYAIDGKPVAPPPLVPTQIAPFDEDTSRHSDPVDSGDTKEKLAELQAAYEIVTKKLIEVEYARGVEQANHFMVKKRYKQDIKVLEAKNDLLQTEVDRLRSPKQVHMNGQSSSPNSAWSPNHFKHSPAPTGLTPKQLFQGENTPNCRDHISHLQPPI